MVKHNFTVCLDFEVVEEIKLLHPEFNLSGWLNLQLQKEILKAKEAAQNKYTCNHCEVSATGIIWLTWNFVCPQCKYFQTEIKTQIIKKQQQTQLETNLSEPTRVKE